MNEKTEKWRKKNGREKVEGEKNVWINRKGARLISSRNQDKK